MNGDKSQIVRYPIPDNARCERCGGSNLAAMPKYFAGMGTLQVPFNEAVLCWKCGHSGAFALAKTG